MEPTGAPWAKGGSAQANPASRHTGRPIAPLIPAEPALPSPEKSGWPSQWAPAKKAITSEAQLKQALKGDTLHSFVSFILSLNESVVGKRLSDPCTVSNTTTAILDALERLSALCKEIPPVQHAVRYGNPGYRTWFDKMAEAAPELVYNILGDDLGEATVELMPYFLDSFGNRTRIDYGTGHEATFVSFLYCLFAVGALSAEDCQATVTRTFARYIHLMRQVQTTYWLEPAGSHGVWGLDEYHFMPFLWGAAQLRERPVVAPAAITSDEALEDFASEYLYLDGVRFVRTVKKGPLHETSPMLYDISGVPNWLKVNQGLVKMFQVEVLSKLPIMQHSLWGHLMPLK